MRGMREGEEDGRRIEVGEREGGMERSNDNDDGWRVMK